MTMFMFATGIENSYPVVGGKRVDEMAKCRHYDHWQADFDAVEDLGIGFLRYGPPIHTTWLGDGKYDWSFADATFGDLLKRDITPIVDLCHFGLPDWLGNFQNGDFPALFARYAADFARRFPWIQLYTPINEMFICALFSAKYGWWNEALTSDRSFVTALKHIVRGNVLAMNAILDVRADAIFIQSESSEYFHADNPAAIGPAEVLNSLRFLSLDLNFGRRAGSEMYQYLLDNGMTRDEYDWFMNMRLKQHCIMGNDYYLTNEHRVAADGSSRASGEVFGYDGITWQYFDRYRLPVMHTETNLADYGDGELSVDWLWKQWASVLRVRNDGIPMVGFTWYSLTDQVDWDTALREDNGRVNPLGLYDLDRKIRPVGAAYKQLIKDWGMVLPTQSVCMVVPLVRPSEFNDPWAQRRRAEAEAMRRAKTVLPSDIDGTTATPKA
jgi:beta-glucosidase/6-phospho-beta-glucosidase/beta-galactosidase